MTESDAPGVLWREGMFLCPQHFQAFRREIGSELRATQSLTGPARFGLHTFEVDEEALKRDVFRITELRAVLRDGSSLVLPTNVAIEQREFGEFFTGPDLMVYVGVAAAQQNVPQIGAGAERRYRFNVVEETVYDENDRNADRRMEFRVFNGHLFFGDEDRSGYESIPIARLIRAGKPEAVSQLCPDFVPPVVRCGAVPALVEALEDIAERTRSQARDLAATLPDTTRLSSIDNAADLTGVIKLQGVNRCLGVFEQLAATPDVDPFAAWLELVRGIGELGIFRAERVMPVLPGYRHDALGESLRPVLDLLRELLGAQVSVPYDRTAFEEDADQGGVHYAPIPSEWLDANPAFYLGVDMAQSPEQCAELIGAGVKLLAPDDLEHVLQGVLPGVELRPVRIPPPAFPKRPDLHFFEIDTEGTSRDLWLNVVRARKAMILSALGEIETVSYGLFVELRG